MTPTPSYNAECVLEAQETIQYGTALLIPAGDIVALLDRSPHSYDELREEVRRGFSSDTSVREQLADLVAQELVGRRWPSYGDPMSNDELDAFYESVAQAANARGWLAEGSGGPARRKA